MTPIDEATYLSLLRDRAELASATGLLSGQLQTISWLFQGDTNFDSPLREKLRASIRQNLDDVTPILERVLYHKPAPE